MDNFEAEFSLRIVGHLLAAIDQYDRRIADCMREAMLLGANDDPVGKAALDAVEAIISVRSDQPTG